MNKFKPNNTKGVVIALLSLVLLWLTWFLLNNTWLTISYSSDENIKATIKNVESGSTVKEVTLKNGSETLFLPRDTYRVEVVNTNKLSVYKKSLAILRDNLDVELKPQRESIYIDKNTLSCTAKGGQGSRTFYSCNPSNDGLVELSSVGKKVIPVYEAEAEENISNEGIYSLSLQPYRNGFLDARTIVNNLYLTKRDVEGYFVKDQNIVVEEFKGPISDKTFSVDKASGTFAVYDSFKNELITSNKLQKAKLARIKLPEDIKELQEGAQVEVFASSQQVFVIIREVGEDHDKPTANREGHTRQAQSGNVDQKVIIVDIEDKIVSDVVGLPDELIIQSAYVNTYGDIIVLPTDADQEPLLISNSNKGREINFFHKGIRGLCWQSNDSFYYIADSGKSIYQYSLSKQASYLIYGGAREAVIENLMCASGEITFVVNPTEGVAPEDNYFYKLSSQVFSGRNRVEGVLPLVLFQNSGRDSLVNLQFESGKVKIIAFDPSKTVHKSRENLKSLVIDELQSRGIDTTGLKYTFSLK